MRSEEAPLEATCRALLTSIYREYILTRVGCSTAISPPLRAIERDASAHMRRHQAVALPPVSWDAMQLEKQGFTMRVDDVAGNICLSLRRGPRGARHGERRHGGRAWQNLPLMPSTHSPTVVD
jgi:hypothetical protein